MSDRLDPWLDKKEAAMFWACSPRSIEYAITEGMPHARRGEVYDGGDHVNAPAALGTPRGRTPGGSPGAN